MSLPSMVHRSGETLVVRSVVSGDTLFEDTEQSDELSDVQEDKVLPECKIRRNYSCGSCDYFTQNPRHFLYHLRDVHNEKVRIYECPNCLYASKHFQKLLRHTKMVHGSTEGIEIPEVRVNKAKKRTQDEMMEGDDNSTDVPDIEEEIESVSEKNAVKCSLCSFTAKSQAQLTKHEREEHIKTKFFRCTKCTYVTHMKARFTKHVKYHSMPMIKCDLCDFRTPYKWNLDRHCKNHNGKGAFRCSACNFTADIKQSLTVHEMNHHVPPVGQAAGLGVGRRRNKVGASDSTAVEEAAQVTVSAAEATKKPAQKLKIPTGKKSKSANCSDQSAYGSDFIHPDDIIHHANGNIYIKNKCKLCNYKSAWDGEMAKHEKKVHNIDRDEPKVAKKNTRPVPNLIPIPTQSSVLKLARSGVSLLKAPEIETSTEPVMSEKDINDICSKSHNSALKDMASLFGSEDVFKQNHLEDSPSQHDKIPDLLPAKIGPKPQASNFKQKNASFFDRLKEKLLTTNGEAANLTCQFCGHESKCLSESVTHQKSCGKEKIQAYQLAPIHNMSSTRCQYCRQRCKSSTDLYNHLQTCTEALKAFLERNLKYEKFEEEKQPESVKIEVEEIKVEENEPHPMENKVFVWNNIEVPMDVDIDEQVDHPHYDYIDDKQDNISLDLSIRTQSPCSENSFIGTSEPIHNQTTITDKIPTHGTDISIAQHKRVFKCPHCTFWASTASRFHVHIVGHLNKKPFECSLCAYRSNWRWDITKHIKLKSVRDPQHENAKVLMTDETGRRNYTKYNKYLTEIHVTGDHTETSGGSGTRPKVSYDSPPSQVYTSKIELPKLPRTPSSSDFSPLLRNTPLRPPPALKAADGTYLAKLSSEKKRNNSENRKTLWKCKKCNFRDASREKLLQHVKGHYQPTGPILNGAQFSSASLHGTETDEASVGGVAPRGHAPFRCGHCHQVSNWKHVIQRHCRLKHQGDIKVVIGSKNGPEKIEVDEQIDEPDHVDLPQLGAFKCKKCPFSNNDPEEFESHLEGHNSKPDSNMKCFFCLYFVSKAEDLYGHLKFHGISEPEEYVAKMLEKNSGDGEPLKRYRCMTCPYVTNSKSQYLYHKQFHKPRGGQYTCTYCSYNVSKRHLLHQHLKVHGINISPQKQNGEVIDLDEVSDEIEEVAPPNFDSQQFTDIPLVWVSRNGKFSKMFKCRYCPHVNLRKVNIQEHEKMHSIREKNPNSSRSSDVEHHCPECNYVCNNAGVLSSHSKVHQGSNGTIHCLVDSSKADEEQIRELSKFISINQSGDLDEDENNEIVDELQVDTIDDGTLVFFCQYCPARFFKENEFEIHVRLHTSRLYYKCDYCSYSARQKPHILAHNKVHSPEYQERTKQFLSIHTAHPEHQPPQIKTMVDQSGSPVFVAENAPKDYDSDNSPIIVKPQRSTMNVPLSGTELFQQKSEAQLKQATEKFILKPEPAPLTVDPQFGLLMHGNPNFIYPTYLKNGRMKEKRYKCPKCPSAFEKREQYKVHLNLHGSKQKYKCKNCDYSVKYYANFVQHVKKHQMNEDAQMARKSSESNNEEEVEPEPEEPSQVIPAKRARKSSSKTETASRTSSTTSNSGDERKLFWCSVCPYTNHRKDAVDNHQKKHASLSGFSNTYTCEYCDYTVPQAHFLRDHVKVHFQAFKMQKAEGILDYDNDNIKLVASPSDDSTTTTDEEDVPKLEAEDEIFEEVERGSYIPPINEDLLQRLNNNEGEKIFVNPETGEFVDKSKRTVHPVAGVGLEVSLEASTSISQMNSDK